MPDNNVRTLDPKQYIITFGPVVLDGFAEDEFINVTSDEAFEKTRGADGGIDRVNKNVFDYRVTATLKQTSLSNQALTLLFQADQNTNTGKLPLVIRDLSGTTVFAADQAWIVKLPDSPTGNTINNREWMFDTGPALFNLGGNNA